MKDTCSYSKRSTTDAECVPKHLLMIHLLVVLDLEKAKDAQAKEIADLKKTKEREVRYDADMFDINDLHGDEVNMDIPVGDNQEQSAKEREVDTSVEDSAAPTTIEEITLAQTLIQIKAAKPKVPEVPLKRKDQVALDEDLARNLQAQLEAEIIERQQKEDAW
ncbi:hypothetical protein Tco_1418994 [Tanacetum coccineum]